MSTNSTIGIINKDNSVDSIYCHSDGYLSHMTEVLSECYASEEKARELVNLGGLSFLDRKVKPDNPESHSFDHREEGVTVAYVRDRGEDWESNCPKHYDNIHDFNMDTPVSGSYTYLFDTRIGKWVCHTEAYEPYSPFERKLLDK